MNMIERMVINTGDTTLHLPEDLIASVNFD